MIGIPVGLLYANAMEWVIHKHVLHGTGKRRSSFWSFHFHEHHQASRRNEMVDGDYDKPLRSLDAQGKEALGLLLLGVAHAPLLPVAPWFTATLWASGMLYYTRHKRAHQDAEWGRENLPWHYDHHMGPNQDSNWCVTFPWFDHVMGTREPYAGTEREAQDRARREARAARKAARKTEVA
ncbi:MAG: sterol desaturase/sphingolipid hydroxylase (fatty acid hydroxylase superfamily) [Myxococcota bacterium]|jgi:sterol desaturase/sphingolipid hydroxylase (fatty acid hydroxylase superfamily)